ncbi:MAG: phosphotransferase [Chloroflexi bacterium]|nr:phosphotransferase [Chloroflexota bacterium]
MNISDGIKQAGAACFDFDPVALRRREHGGAPDGVLFDVERDGVPFIIKFIPTTPDAINATREKIEFVHHLGINGVNVPDYLSSAGGKRVELVESEGETFAVLKMRRASGRHIWELLGWDTARWPDSFFERWGQTLGRIHALSQRYAGGTAIAHWTAEHSSFVDWCSDPAVGEKWQQVGETLHALPEPADAFGLTHNDLHTGNMLVDGDTITVLDFDVCTRHWFALDIAIALFHPIWEHRHRPAPQIEAFAQRLTRLFMAGYCRENTLDPAWIERLPLFARYRQILSFIALSGQDEPGPNPWREAQLRDLRRWIVDDLPIPGAAIMARG